MFLVDHMDWLIDRGFSDVYRMSYSHGEETPFILHISFN